MTGILALHPDAIADLEAIASVDPDAAALIQVALQEIESDPRLADRLLDHGFGVGPDGKPYGTYAVSKWMRFWAKGRDIWRLRCVKLEEINLNFRVVYAYLVSQASFCVLAIVRKDEINYDDSNDKLAIRVRNAYDGL